MKEYLKTLNIPNEQKNECLLFYQKMNYIHANMGKVITKTGMKVHFGYGDYNSKICLLGYDYNTFNLLKDGIREKLEKFGCNFWDVYTTYLYKTDQHRYEQLQIDFLAAEIAAINPKIIYCFFPEDMVDKFRKYVPESISVYCTENINAPETMGVFKYLINYRK